MKKTFFIFLFVSMAISVYSQDFSLIFNQNGYIQEGRVIDNHYYLSGCTFDVKYTQASTYLRIDVFNPTSYGFVPASYFLYNDGSMTVVCNQEQYQGAWRVTPGGPNFGKELPSSATIRKKIGTSNTFIITVGNYSVEVQGGTKSVTIDNVRYLLPDLK